MANSSWYSVFIYARHDGHTFGWRKVAEIDTAGLIELAVQAWRKLYGKGCVHASPGKNAKGPAYIPTDIYGASAFDKPE